MYMSNLINVDVFFHTNILPFVIGGGASPLRGAIRPRGTCIMYPSPYLGDHGGQRAQLWVTMSREYHITNNDIVGDHGPYAIVWAIIATIVYTNPIYPYRSRNCGSTGGFERANLYTV